MFPTLRRRNRPSPIPATPAMTHEAHDAHDAAGVLSSPSGAREPRTALRRPVRGLTGGGRIIGLRRRLPTVVAAACVLAASAATAHSGNEAQHLVQHVTSQVIEELEAQRESIRDDPERLYELVDRLVLPYFDFERMSRRVLGKRWKKATPDQQMRFVAAFRTRLVRTYATVLNEYTGQTLTYLDPIPRKEGEVVIPVDIRMKGSQSVRVAYAMHGSGEEWSVFDVAIDGVSLVTNYRSSFRAEIARNGIEGLIARLESQSAGTN